MSRNVPQKYKISNPQPLSSPSGGYDGGGYSAYNGSNNGYQPSNGESSQNGTPGGSPSRPARSRMRDAPQVGPGPDQPSSGSRAAPPRQPLGIQTQGLRRPSNTSQDLGYGNSPIDMYSPAGTSAQGSGGGMFQDPFAADKAQRNQLRAQTSAAQQAATQLPSNTPGGDKLRNAVGAFIAAGKQRSLDSPSDGMRRPQRSARRPPAEESNWDLEEPDGSEFGEIDVVLRKIKKDWPFILESDFSPSTLSLSLLSQHTNSSLPNHPSLSSFLRLNEALSTALQSAVQAHFQTFAASLPAHSTFLSTLGRAQDQVKKSKADLQEARDGFAGKGKGELSGIRGRERMVRDMLKILDTLDHLKSVPDRLESLIGDKKFLQAAMLLVRSLKSMGRTEISDLGAMSDLRSYFSSQETTLTDILIEELHNHIYLKTFYSDSRWQAYAPGQTKLPPLDLAEMDPTPPTSARASVASISVQDPSPSTSSRFSKYISSLSVKPNQDPMLDYMEGEISDVPIIPNIHKRTGSQPLGQADSHASLSSILEHGGDLDNPEADSFAYIETLLEALAVLGRLGVALNRLVQRVGGEVHALIESTLDEVESRTEIRREEAAAEIINIKPLTGAGGLPIALYTVGPPHHTALLKDLFWTLYSKLAAVLEGHRIVYEVSRWISSRREFKDTTLKANATLQVPVLDIWRPIQNEVRAIGRSYLTDETHHSVDHQQLMSMNEIIRDGKIARNKTKPMFKFSNTDSRAHNSDFEALQQVLKVSVPGLVTVQETRSENVMQGEMADAEDRYSTGNKHRNIIPPNVFNVTTLFQPTLAFIDRVEHIIPPGFAEETSAFSTVLEDFVVRVFLPQLDERVTASFAQATTGYDSYQIDRTMASDVEKPPLKSSARVMALIHNLCFMLQTTPFHRENYSRLIVGVIVQYYQTCSARFKELASLSGPDTPLSLPATWAQREDIITLLKELREVPSSDKHEISILCHKEIKQGLDLLGNKPLHETELIRSPRKLEALGQLAESLRWFIDSLLDIQEVSDETTVNITADLSKPKLPLTKAMMQRFEAIIQTYEQLTEMVVNTMRLEVRGRIVCNLGAAMRGGDYLLATEAMDLDPDVVDLNSSLIESEEILTRTLSSEDRSFIILGLNYLIDHLFIVAARSIKVVNTAGVEKIKRNIMSLQQFLGSAGASEDALSRSMTYWDLYNKGPKYMLEELKSGRPMFTFEDYNTMLNLQCKESASDQPSSELNTYLIDLHALSMSIDGWEIGTSD